MKAGVDVTPQGARFCVHAPRARAVSLCLLEAGQEVRHPMTQQGAHWTIDLPGLGDGARYAYRAEGAHAPEQGLWFDPAKRLIDPAVTEIDRAYRYDPALGEYGAETGDLMPWGLLRAPLSGQPPAPLFQPGGLIYELNVRGFTMRHPDVPEAERGTVAALAHPSVIAHLTALGVDAVELMPITAWIDERHLPPLGLTNAWGYNPVTFRALDPRLCPGGVAELQATVAALRAAGIGVILDLVFNHTGESDTGGPTLSYRGLDPDVYRTGPHGLVNDTGCGNTVDCARDAVRADILETLRHFARCGVDGFRFDLAPIMGRNADGFSAQAVLFQEMAACPVISSRVLIAEPWDIGPGGYQLGKFPDRWLEWNDAARDDMRRFWRGDVGAGVLATRLAGSSDVFDGAATRSVNFIAAHDGFTLWDMVAHTHKHNHANGEDNRDGHNENISWNNGVEGASDDPRVTAARRQDVKALLGTLFASRGTIMLTAGDEFGRSQQGNNNAYAQDNEITWLDWAGRDLEIEAHAQALGQMRRAHPDLRDLAFLTDETVTWHRPDGGQMRPEDWARRAFAKVLPTIAILVNGTDAPVHFTREDQMVPARSVIMIEGQAG
ncbi:glycogen debranching protein GlgX [Rubricella aquisinus]|nr:glycogen debranching protein GlgX [Rubricella aquisinus]